MYVVNRLPDIGTDTHQIAIQRVRF